MFGNTGRPKKSVIISFQLDREEVRFEIPSNRWKRDAAWHASVSVMIGGHEKVLFIKQLSGAGYTLVNQLAKLKRQIPNTPKILYCGQEDGIGFFYVTEFLSGRTLAEIDTSFLKKVLDKNQIGTLWKAVANAVHESLRELSDAGLMYVDLSPKNIMVTDRFDEAWIIDIDSCVPLQSSLKGDCFDNRFTLVAANQVMQIGGIWATGMRLWGIKADVVRTQAAIIGFVRFLTNVAGFHKNQQPTSVIETLAGPHTTEHRRKSREKMNL